MKNDLTRDLLLELFDYDREKGKLYWRESRGNRAAGAEAGYTKPNGRTAYLNTSVNNSTYKVHRLIWLIETGEWPDTGIDHIDGDGLNNKFSNLRAVPHKDNMRNKRLYKGSVSGISGVTWDKKVNKWRVRFRRNGREIYLGTFDTLLDAAAARISAANKLGFTARHGRESH